MIRLREHTKLGNQELNIGENSRNVTKFYELDLRL